MIRNNRVAMSVAAVVVFETPDTGNCSILVKNVSTTVTVYVGDEHVTTANGYPLAPGEVVAADLIGGEYLYGVCDSTSEVAVFRQNV